MSELVLLTKLYNGMFFSFGKHWKGVYIHVPGHTYRIFWSRGKLGFDHRKKNPQPAVPYP